MNNDNFPIKCDVKVTVDSAEARKLTEKIIDTLSSPFKWFFVNRRPLTAQTRDETRALELKVEMAKKLSTLYNIDDRDAMELCLRSNEYQSLKCIKEQQNIETIVLDAAQIAPAILPAAKINDDPVDEDWTMDFLSKAKNIGNKEMQSLWSKILAGEVSKPGSYSKRVLDFVYTLSPKEADLFTRFCGLVCKINFKYIHLRLSDNAKGFSRFHGYPEYNITYDDILELDAIGLINFKETVLEHKFDSGKITYDLKPAINTLCIDYFDEIYIVKPSENFANISLSIILLTNLGNSLVPICGSEKNDNYKERLLEIIKQNGRYQISSLNTNVTTPNRDSRGNKARLERFLPK